MTHHRPSPLPEGRETATGVSVLSSGPEAARQYYVSRRRGPHLGVLSEAEARELRDELDRVLPDGAAVPEADVAAPRVSPTPAFDIFGQAR